MISEFLLFSAGGEATDKSSVDPVPPRFREELDFEIVESRNLGAGKKLGDSGEIGLSNFWLPLEPVLCTPKNSLDVIAGELMAPIIPWLEPQPV